MSVKYCRSQYEKSGERRGLIDGSAVHVEHGFGPLQPDCQDRRGISMSVCHIHLSGGWP